MPITSTNVTVNCSGNGSAGQTALVAPNTGSPQVPIEVRVYNPGPGVLWTGGPAVTSGNGIPVLAAAVGTFNLSTGNDLYAVFNSVTTTVSVFKTNS